MNQYTDRKYVFTVVIILGIMGFMGIPLDAGTVLIASISLGVAVDDTVYFLSAYRYFSKNLRVSEAIRYSYHRVWKALTITTIILIFGFSILALSEYKPVINLGIFVSLNLFFAIMYDFIVLPGLILSFSLKNSG